jgi:hypothetical protein
VDEQCLAPVAAQLAAVEQGLEATAELLVDDAHAFTGQLFGHRDGNGVGRYPARQGDFDRHPTHGGAMLSTIGH